MRVMTTHPFSNPNAYKISGGNVGGIDVDKARAAGIMSRFDTLFWESCQLDAAHSSNLNVISQKAIRGSAELPFGFSRIRLMPRISDHGVGDNQTDPTSTYVKRPNNVLFGISEMYVFVPDQVSERFRDPIFESALVDAFIAIGEDGSKKVYAISPDGMNELQSLSQIAEALTDGSALNKLPGSPVSSSELETLYDVVAESSIVDQDDRSPIMDI